MENWSIEAGIRLSLLAVCIADCKRLLGATCRSSLFHELGIATQRSMARDIIELSRRPPEHVSAQLTTDFRGVQLCACPSFCFTFFYTFA
jgi:hypothetical protein